MRTGLYKRGCVCIIWEICTKQDCPKKLCGLRFVFLWLCALQGSNWRYCFWRRSNRNSWYFWEGVYCKIINRNAEYSSERYEIINSRHCSSALPLVNGLRCGEAKDVLNILYGEPRGFAKLLNVYSCCGHIYDRYTIHFIFAPIPALAGTGVRLSWPYNCKSAWALL